MNSPFENRSDLQDHCRVVERHLQYKRGLQLIRRDSSVGDLLNYCPLTDPLATLSSSPAESRNNPMRESDLAPLAFSKQTLSSTTLATDANSDEDTLGPPIESIFEHEDNLSDCPRILQDESWIHQLHQALPDSLQLCPWTRCFAIGRDGDSLHTLTEQCRPYRNSILVIRTTQGHVLGGFATARWSRRPDYTGSGQSFLFASHATESEGLDIYRWTGANAYCQRMDDGLAMGGVGEFGFYVGQDLIRGRSGHCQTFGNPPLVPSIDGFDVEALEIYGLAPLSMVFGASGSP